MSRALPRRARAIAVTALALSFAYACRREDAARALPMGSASAAPGAASGHVNERAPDVASFTPEKIDLVEPAMGTEVHFIAYTTPKLGGGAIRDAMRGALAEIVRLESLMTSWRDSSEIGQINANAGTPMKVSAETMEVLQKSKWAGDVSGGVFDISFHALGDLWRFGDAAEADPKLPDPKIVAEKKKLVDYRKVTLDPAQHTARIAPGMKIDLGGIAKGYAVDRAAAVLERAGLENFLAQAGGDLFGKGRKPDGSPWVSGIQDPRGPTGTFFATIELTDHAFSTAGDYARAFFVKGKRYHHIIDPRTGYPATACRSVTVWAKDAFTADAVDDAVFILGPEKGLKIIDSLPDAGAVVVDAHNKVWISDRLKDKVRVLHPPTDGP